MRCCVVVRSCCTGPLFRAFVPSLCTGPLYRTFTNLKYMPEILFLVARFYVSKADYGMRLRREFHPWLWTIRKMQMEDSGSRTKPPETGKLCVFSCNGVKVKYNTNVHDRWERFLRDVKAACIFKTVKTVLKKLFKSTVFFQNLLNSGIFPHCFVSVLSLFCVFPSKQTDYHVVFISRLSALINDVPESDAMRCSLQSALKKLFTLVLYKQ